MLTIGALARRFGLSRSTLLYYSRTGLLRPATRTEANYRLYGPEDVERLRMICVYREAGVPLTEIKALLDSDGARVDILRTRLRELNRTIARYREQQRVVIRLLQNRSAMAEARALDKDQWVAILSGAGLDEDGRRRWHQEFERQSPHGHQDFLESLGIDEEDIARIRAWSREPD